MNNPISFIVQLPHGDEVIEPMIDSHLRSMMLLFPLYDLMAEIKMGIKSTSKYPPRHYHGFIRRYGRIRNAH